MNRTESGEKHDGQGKFNSNFWWLSCDYIMPEIIADLPHKKIPMVENSELVQKSKVPEFLQNFWQGGEGVYSYRSQNAAFLVCLVRLHCYQNMATLCGILVKAPPDRCVRKQARMRSNPSVWQHSHIYGFFHRNTEFLKISVPTSMDFFRFFLKKTGFSNFLQIFPKIIVFIHLSFNRN